MFGNCNVQRTNCSGERIAAYVMRKKMVVCPIISAASADLSPTDPSIHGNAAAVVGDGDVGECGGCIGPDLGFWATKKIMRVT